MQSQILIIEDEENLRQLLSRIIELEGYEVHSAKTGKLALKLLENHDFHLVLSDVRLPDLNGLDLITTIKQKNPLTEVVFMTAFGSIPDSVKAIKDGAFDYITKGDADERIIPIIDRAVEKAVMQRRIHQLERKVADKHNFDSILGSSGSIKEAISLAKKVAATDTTVLLLGETGTGKEVFAQAIHYESKRNLKPFVAINCSAISKDLLESEMFGHKAGAFTGAVKDKKGLVEEANDGTLFLDEIGELSHDLQAKLLRFIETGTFNKVGDSKTTKVDVRIIAATNRKLEDEVEKETFRADLYYRLSVFTITLPSLRNRKEDILVLAEHFVKLYSAKLNKPESIMSEKFRQSLLSYPYKGNIRELKNIIERAVILTEDNTLSQPLQQLYNQETEYSLITLSKLEDVEKQHISRILQMTNGNKTKSAEILGIGLTTLYRKLQEYGI
ncbi:MAG: sigma-54-dependent Fis family transcriptional regulator [Sphingobacteriales bacterium]|nr:MAG: sigma-54-dependent Fis family transcriptional regulator [Sphingobacteriales bacterium]